MTRKLLFVALVGVYVLLLNVAMANAQGPKPENSGAPSVGAATTFTYQGQLKKNGNPVNGTCTLTFDLYDAASGGAHIAGPVNASPNPTIVTNGLYTTEITFAASVFQGDARWLQTTVLCTGDPSSTVLPLQQLTAVPYAIGLRPGASISATLSSDVYAVKNYGTGDAVNGYANGTGRAGYFMNNNASNSKETLYAGTNSVANAIRAVSTYNGSGCCPPAIYGESTQATQGVGVIGIASKTSGANYGVAGQTSSPQGKGIQGNAINGGIGVYGVSNTGVGIWARSTGTTLNAPALFAENLNTSATEPAGIAIYARNQSGDSTIVASNGGSGDIIRVLNSAENLILFSVQNNGKVIAPVVQITGGADVAERFSTAANTAVEPGTVMVIDPDHPGKLKVSDTAYDSKVIGIVSGAGGVGTGLSLQQEGMTDGDLSVAMVGRVYCKAEATQEPIQPGDFITTSSIPGYCMKASDRARAQGATIGKAMTTLDHGTGLILVVVNLQ